MEFSEWYTQHHGYPPFPWQERLARDMAEGKTPDTISIPTACGKTAIIAIWQWAHECNLAMPTRLIYVVDRRLLVDSITEYATQLGCNVVTLRGGMTHDNSWLMAPNTPTVIISTVDQAGSRLLFRGYGVSNRVAPIHAALVGVDALIILDEAHISTPFLSTLREIKELRVATTKPWQIVAMTATPTPDSQELSFSLDTEDYKNLELKKRLCASKKAKLVKCTSDSFITKLVEEAQQKELDGIVGVLCNSAKQARRVFERLKGNKILLTGRIRPADRDALLEEHLGRIRCNSQQPRPNALFVVATQTIEIGADIDFDVLITQLAPIDALRQRFGRLNRLGLRGESEAVIIYVELKGHEACPIYGKSTLKKTWNWLKAAQTGKGKDKYVDFGINAFDKTLTHTPPPLRIGVATRPLTELDIRHLRQTEPIVPMDITPWLHGEQQSQIAVSIVWRSDLLEADQDKAIWPQIVAAAPPVIYEEMPCPIYEVREWLGERKAVVNNQLVGGRQLQPGDTLIVPSSYGGYDKWGWAPNRDETVSDIGNQYGKHVRLIGADETTDIMEALEALEIAYRNPVATPYPMGLVIQEANQRIKSKAVLLDAHLQGCRDTAIQLTSNEDVIAAAAQHDLGKQELRFQVLLGAKEIPLAKSSHRSPHAAKLARAWSGLPKGWRHENASLLYLPQDTSDLVKYLVATHHGFNRSILTLGGDPELWQQLGGHRWGNMSEALNQEFGAWGLAYLEALVRLADWLQSQQEQANV